MNNKEPVKYEPEKTRQQQEDCITRQIVEHPPHYTSHPSGIECIEITRHMGFNLGNVVKYAWRCDLKHDAIEDLEKAIVYLRDEIKKRRKQERHAGIQAFRDATQAGGNCEKETLV